jgi:hypothetical protein
MTTQGQPVRSNEDWSVPPAEHYSDVFWLALNPWSVVITFGHRQARPEEKDTPTVRMRMSLQQAKILSIMLLRAIRQYEKDTKVNVDLPKQMLQMFGVSPEDWDTYKG